jgi:polysaccharide export outer membrane protein
MRLTLRWIMALMALLAMPIAMAATPAQGDYRLSPGDSIRVYVYQYPDLMYDTRVAESGVITYPLIGELKVGGSTIAAAETKIADALKDGGYVKQPQVHIVLQTVGSQVSVLGEVSHPGPFPLQKVGTRLSEVLSAAGVLVVNTPGAAQGSPGADTVIVRGERDAQPFRRTIDLNAIFADPDGQDDMVMSAGDVVYVPPAAVYYIYGQVQRPGSYVIARGMTIEQALAQAGGPTIAGSESRLRLDRRGSDGSIGQTHPAENTPIEANDVLFVPSSIF